ncbi:MAG: transposase, partial [Akkermansiaceae bacterium]
HTFGDYLVFHPHLHVLVADGLFAPDGRFHCLPKGAIVAPFQFMVRSK